MIRVFDVVSGHTCRTVKPNITNHPVFRWMGAGGERLVSNDGFGVCMGMMRVVVDHAFV